MSHCQRGDEVLVGQEAHTYRYEAGGGAVLGSIQPQAIANRPDGTLDLAEVEAAIKPDDPHFARTRLLALENTITGRVIPRKYFDEALALAKRRGLATHLDGARIFNAAVKLGMPVKDLCRGFDSVSACLSKGLGAPAGTMLVGSKDFIARAKRARKILGGVMRQAGVLAAAGLYALEHNVQRLAEDHANAERLARGLGVGGAAVEHGVREVLAGAGGAPGEERRHRAAGRALAPGHASGRRRGRHRARDRGVQIVQRIGKGGVNVGWARVTSMHMAATRALHC